MSHTDINNCNFYTNEICKGRLRKIYETDIPETNKNIITVGMFLCQTHYNQLILNESLKIKQTKTCQHPKHEVYLSEAKLTNTNKSLVKIPKRLIKVLELNEFAEICNMCKKRTDKDPEYLQSEKYEASIIKKKDLDDNNDNLQNDLIEVKQIEICQHPKHEIYLNDAKLNDRKIKENKNLTKVPERLIETLELNEFAKICSMCRRRTDNDPEYLQNEKYKAPISRKNNNNNISKIGNHTYSFRKDILYTGEELQQFELDYQEIITQLKISNEIKLSSKIIKMSSILYNNQHRLNLKPIYDPIAFKTMLETTDEDLIGFFDELYAGTNPNTKSEITNNNNKKKLVSLCYFLASINNKYINGIKVDIGSYLETSEASSSSIDTLANLGVSVTRKTVNRKKNLISDEHQQTVDDYCLQNIENMFILNIDDYHNIHRRNQPTLLQTHNIYHFVTILLNTNAKIPRIPFYSLNNFSIHNPKGIDSELIINSIKNNFMDQLGKSYYIQKESWKNFLIEDSYENRVELLNIHNYDGRIQNYHELRSMSNSKLVDFILHPLHSTKDYIECLDHVFKAFERLENIKENYLNNFIIPVIADCSGQVNIT